MGEPPSKKRKVRKGTRSCWQCRKRKIRCEFASSDAQTCAGCQVRGITCVSQEFTDDAPSGLPESSLAQRLGRLEEMMVKLAEKLGPGSTNDKSSTPTSSVDESLYASESFPTPEKLVRPTTTNVAAISRPSTSSPSVPTAAASLGALHRHEGLCKELFSTFPSPRSVKTLVESSRGPIFILVLFYSNRDILDGKSPPTASLSTLPDASKHPAILAKRLLELAICLQQLPPSYDTSQLGLRGSVHDTMNAWAAAAGQVTSNDELVGSAEGLQCLVLQGFYLINSGNLRKAWLAMRRALSLAQLIGIERNGSKPLTSCDPAADRATIPASPQVWYRINMCDRYLSLLLGLPAGTKDNSFMSESYIAGDTPVERLEKRYVAISLRVIERNHASAGEAYEMTQSIDCELESAANAMGGGWWVMPPLPGEEADVTSQMGVMSQLMLQIQHHSLLILLHLPYMLRSNPTDNRFDYSKNVCLESSRAVLRRCVTFRTANNASFSCRHIDYSSLMAAMTLLLGHLSRPPGFRDDEWLRQRAEDRALAESVTAMMEGLAVLNDDKLSGESAETIKQLLPIIGSGSSSCCCDDSAARHPPGAAEARNVQLSVPYLGTININTTSSSSNHVTAACHVDLGHSQLPTPANTTTVTPSSSSSSSSMSPNRQQANASVSVDPLLGEQPDSAVGAEDVYAAAAAALGLNHAALGLDPDCLEWPCPGVTAEAGDWAFQGVDTTYWSLLNSGISSGFSQ